MGHGKHRRPTDNTLTMRRIALGASVTLGGSLIPATVANAASVDAWDKIAECESSGLWNRPDGDGGRSSGGLQFQPASWNDALAYLERQGVDTSDYPKGPGHQAYKATKRQQIIAGEGLLALQGPRAWTCNAMVGSPLQSSGPNASMFKGGDFPYPDLGGQPPADPPPVTPKPPVDVPPVDVNCDYFSTPVYVQPGDPHDLDRDGDGIGCDANPGAPVAWPGIDKPKPPAEKPGKGHGHGHKHKHPHKHKGKHRKDNRRPESYIPHDHYTVAPGDTLYTIATAKSIKGGWQELYRWNTRVVDDPHMIYPGQELNLPADAKAPAPAPEKPAEPAPEPPAEQPEAPAPAAFHKPVDAPLTGPYGQPGSWALGYHPGADFAAPAGTPVYAVAAGKVVVSASSGGAGGAYGNHIVVDHGNNKFTLYAHLSTRNVWVGQEVAPGEKIGAVGSTGRSSGPHLHLELRNHPTNYSASVFSDPVAWLRANGVNL